MDWLHAKDLIQRAVGGGLLSLVLLVLACQEAPQSYRRTMHLFPTYRAQDPASVEVEGQPDARWVQLDEEVIPVLMGNSGFSVWFKSDRVERGPR